MCCWALLPLQDAAGSAEVWVQLLQQCGHLTKCQPLIIQALGNQLAQHKRTIASHERRIDINDQFRRQSEREQQQRTAAVQQQAVAQQQHTAALQRQLDAASAEAAELRGRVVALEGQVQQLLAALQQRG